ncbi:MAG: tripartite tricarboxylate transporter substrate binding protein [Proteobacteria bacterium]|nr:tripartite tricarboxylate transporter substrate binding protein [Pseudomonadota bacterium]MBU2227934.1 tripartite tricarboxylate transporter substrate binding protein [Pseudomonadota bacterium]MBU2260383.1 tripartite tricarboxylate transporter substrate binding protein [Pseudomonadota bacterium]
MKNRRKKILMTMGMLLGLYAAFAFLSASAVLAADPYPSRPVRLIIPFPPGGSNDIVGRLIASKLSESLGKQVVVDNRGGAGGVLGTEMAAKSDPDGYTLLIVSAAYSFSPALYNLPFDPVKSFTPIAKLGSGPNSLTVHPSVPANTVKELIALAKQKPGELINACAGVGSFQHMGTEMFKMMAGIDFKIVQFKGGGPAMIDQLGGHSHFSLGSLIQTLPHIQSGKFRILGTGGAKRSAMLPNVPTISEAGVPGYEATNWWGIIAPAGTPAPIVERLNEDLKVILTSAEVQNLFLKQGAEVDYLGPAEFDPFIAGEIAKWGKVVKEANIKVK